MTKKILVVDDEPDLIRLLGYTLHNAGYEVVVAQTGVDALNKISETQPDLVVLDVMMPDMTGIEVCRRIREHPKYTMLPIIMLSARSQVSDKVAGLEAGADEYVTKPVEMKEMLARVNALFARTERLRQAADDGSTTARVLGVIGAKGGVGTTTVALNIAGVLAQSEEKVIAVEMTSSFGQFSVQLDWHPTGTIAALLSAELPISRKQLTRALVDSPFGGQYLFGPLPDEPVNPLYPEQVENLMDTLAEAASFVIVDIPNYRTPATEAALRACDYVVLVLEGEVMSIMLAQMIKEQLLYPLVGSNFGAVVVNRAGSASSISLSRIKEVLDCPILAMIPPMAEACRAAQQANRPVALHQPDNLSSQNLSDLARRLKQSPVKPLDI